MRRTHPSDYYYKRYRIAQPAGMPVTTVSVPYLEHLALIRQAGGTRSLSAMVHAEAGRLRASGDYKGTLSAAVRRAVKARLG
jgi:hypothetical protein